MTMTEVEKDILNDLEELEDDASQYSYIIACGGECECMAEQYRTEDNLIKQCQVKTWIFVEWKNGRCHLYADSESLIIKGALSLLQDIYLDRTKEEVLEYHGKLFENDIFRKFFTIKQLQGLSAVVDSISASEI